MVFIDSGAERAPEDCQVKGYYFRPQSHICKHFIITVTDTVDGQNTTVTAYETGIPQDCGKEILISNGESVIALDTSLVCSVKLWSKYFFPTFAKNMQLYYDDSLYDPQKKNKTDDVMSIAEVMDFAIKLGLEKAKIKPY